MEAFLPSIGDESPLKNERRDNQAGMLERLRFGTPFSRSIW
jgi:hypothetical protein